MRSDEERSELDISLKRCAGEVPGGVRQVSVFPPLPGVTAALTVVTALTSWTVLLSQVIILH